MLKYLQNKGIKTNKGFLALTSTLIITAVLMMAISATSTSSFFARFDALGSEFKRVSLGLSESCLNAALLKITQNFCYDPTADPDYVSGEGVKVDVGPDSCYISSVTYDTPDCDADKRTVTIKTTAQYPEQNGSWSSNKIVATIQNPAISVTTPPPTCSFLVSPASITQGQNVTIQWSTSGNATALDVVQSIGATNTTIYSGLPSGSPITDAPSASASYSATITGPGGSTQCVPTDSVGVEPPADCADTVLMLDRTGSMANSYPCPGCLQGERDAANGLLDLYDNLDPLPKTSVGVFGAIGSTSTSSFNAEIRQGLTTVYSSLYNAVTTGLATASGGTNLTSAISISDGELNSGNHTMGKNKVLILISDGKATYPSPNPNQSATNAANAAKLATGPGKASDNIPTEIFTIHFGGSGPNNVDQNFLATLATNSANDQFTSGTSPDTGYLPPQANFGDGSSSWSNPTGVYSDGGASASNNTSGRHRFYNFGFLSSPNSIPSGATIRGIEVAADARSSDSNGCSLGVSLSWNGGSTWSNGSTNPSITKSITGLENTYIFGGSSNLSAWGSHSWIPNDFNNGNFRLRIHDVDPGLGCDNSATTFVDYLRAKVYFDGVINVSDENADDDHFFIAPTSADMPVVFDTVG